MILISATTPQSLLDTEPATRSMAGKYKPRRVSHKFELQLFAVRFTFGRFFQLVLGRNLVLSY